MGDPSLNMADFLSQKRKKLLDRWFEATIASYPPETVKFLRREKNKFANPVGRTILEGIEGILDAMLKGQGAEASSVFLDNIIRIRAVQDFTPSQAVDFIFALKRVVRKELGNDLWEEGLAEEYLAFESSVDEMAGMAFNIYMTCREEISEIRMGEMRNRTERILERINSVYGNTETEPVQSDENLNRPT